MLVLDHTEANVETHLRHTRWPPLQHQCCHLH